jgi:hypothetical protein
MKQSTTRHSQHAILNTQQHATTATSNTRRAMCSKHLTHVMQRACNLRLQAPGLSALPSHFRLLLRHAPACTRIIRTSFCFRFGRLQPALFRVLFRMCAASCNSCKYLCGFLSRDCKTRYTWKSIIRVFVCDVPCTCKCIHAVACAIPGLPFPGM